MILRNWICLFVLMLLVGCAHQPSSSPASKARPRNQRDFVLFSWQQSGEWHFALLPAVKRVRTFEEIASPAVSVRGISGLSKRITTLHLGKHDWVGWSNSAEGRQHLVQTAYPPDPILLKIDSDIRSRGAMLIVEKVLGE